MRCSQLVPARIVGDFTMLNLQPTALTAIDDTIIHHVPSRLRGNELIADYAADRMGELIRYSTTRVRSGGS